MSDQQSATLPTVVCLASFEKGADLLREARRLGWHVVLLTVPALEHAASWPRESVDEVFTLPDLAHLPDVIPAVAHLARERRIERVIPLDDYDVETAAALREHLRLPGMGASLARRFRDKLAMRVAARDADIPVPEFVGVINDAAVGEFAQRVPPPWVLKPRSEVSTIGIARIESAGELWPRLDTLGDRRSYHLLEQFAPGGVFHVDSITEDGRVLFAEAHGYFRPPLEVFHQGGMAVTRTLPREGELTSALRELNARVLAALGMERGVAHVELIQGAGGELYFLEAGARVGGAHITEMVEAATGVNLWREWARLELGEAPYTPPERRHDYGGVIITLARQEQPDTSAYTEPEIVYRVERPHHAGFVVASPDQARVEHLLREYGARFAEDFHAVLPPVTDPRAVRDAHHAEEHPAP
ncbi:MAG TPA: hypothetical protein VF116_11685 [Ktedonobacterales bacterium]